MSLSSIALSTRNHPNAANFAAAVPPAGSVTAPTTTIADAANKVAKFIPGDLLTIYLSALAAIRVVFPDASMKCAAPAAQAIAASPLPPTSPIATAAATLGGHLAAVIPHVTPAAGFAMNVFIACMVLAPVYVIGLRFINTPAGTNFVWPLWGVVAAWIAFAIYAPSVDTIWFGCPNVTTTLWIFFIAPLLAFFNEIIAKLWPDQAV